MDMIIVCKFHDPSIIGSRDTEGGGVRGAPPPPPQSQIDQKSPVWIGLTESHSTTLISLYHMMEKVSPAFAE